MRFDGVCGALLGYGAFVFPGFAAVVGLMASAGLTLAGTLKTPAGAGIAAASMLVLIRFEVNPAVLLLLAGAGRIAARLAPEI